VDAILAARRAHRFGPYRLAPLVGVSRSTIGDVLHRHGMSRLKSGARAPCGLAETCSIGQAGVAHTMSPS
jgi:hypothetical protein